ncbi:MAG: hypothetical protein A3C11_00280 [Candidatus Sungbacteria bacterium RIFCSPHIGHO2_02_FULL_49_12]|uniref:L,D-TPase catalytic domain-containing protein n=1 Tax=Candidatus Sungbacteria bacterium RIFCSPHIGHO2_02_FULL_49_12 TaxID=1802271 RepID=A0A1G2KRK1_9BACT|nr:MAG: hypothetical protein A3C11_00280 [Candidatus Sungbacteria bacterium RIFCSPHIGHO2_02_FULL_49_12]
MPSKLNSFLHGAALVGVTIIIFIAGYVTANQISTLAQDEGWFSIPPQIIATETPLYKELASRDAIFSNKEAVLQKRGELTAAKASFIFADLTDLSLGYYKDGALQKQFPIRARGKAGSFFETPNGFYTIQSKEENHFSTIGEVWMPWSMHFFGNYFIHGWPYYPDGTPVSEKFSGGCIRLSSADAKELFYLTQRGLPVLVYSGLTASTSAAGKYYRKLSAVAGAHNPVVSAPAVLAADFESGQILWEKNKDEPHPIASITKLMTALAAVESINRFKVLTFPEDLVGLPQDSSELAAGEKLKSEDLLYPLILRSSNAVAELYKRQVWGFVGIMNQKAKAIGLARTKFADADGASADNISTAEDTFKLLRYIATYKKPIFDLSGKSRHALTAASGEKHNWANVNWPTDEKFLGGKAGSTTAAKETMAGVYNVRFAEAGERPVAVIVLGADDRIQDVRAILTYLEDNFVYGDVFASDNKKRIIREGASIYEVFE